MDAATRLPVPLPGSRFSAACASIRCRLRREIDGQAPNEPEMLALQAQILEDAGVREALGWRQPDGWLAWGFHGARSTEAGLRRLLEKGVEPGHPVIAGALRALADHPERLARGFGKVGDMLDRAGLGGSRAACAALFAQAGREDHPLVAEQVEAALTAFRAVLAVNSREALVETARGRQVLRQGRVWPSIYHLRLLAYSHAWRTPQNLARLGESVQRLVALSPIPAFNVRFGSQLAAPAAFAMQDFNADLSALDAFAWMGWFHRTELLARLGVVGLVPALRRQVDDLAELVAAGDGWFPLRLEHASFRSWGAYTGLMLERDWKDPRRRVYDLTFRARLIAHYAAGGVNAGIG